MTKTGKIKMSIALVIVLAGLLVTGCGNNRSSLPILGKLEIHTVDSNGTKYQDTVYPKLPVFTFLDQDSSLFTQDSLPGHVYVADFIFLSCPTICPRLTAAMKKVYRAYEGDNRLRLISYSIDPAHDTIARLRAYARQLQVQTPKWRFLNGPQSVVMDLADHNYFVTAFPDSTAPGGFTHSGALMLMDARGFMRGVYDGTDSADVQQLIGDISLLLPEK